METGAQGMTHAPEVVFPNPDAYASRVEKAREKATLLSGGQNLQDGKPGDDGVVREAMEPAGGEGQGVSTGRLSRSAQRIAQGAATGGKAGAVVAVAREAWEYRDELSGLVEKAKGMRENGVDFASGLDLKSKAAGFMSQYSHTNLEGPSADILDDDQRERFDSMADISGVRPTP